MALLRWIIGLLAAFAIMIFALANQQMVDVNWSPFHPSLQLPLYLVALGLMALGFFAGSVTVWLSMLPLRINSWKQKKKIKTLEKRLDSPEPPANSPLASVPLLKG